MLLAGINDTDADVARLAKMLRANPAKLNLIPFNAAAPEADGGPTALPFQRPSAERVRAFQSRVMAGGLICIVRETRGDDAFAACGQLAAA